MQSEDTTSLMFTVVVTLLMATRLNRISAQPMGRGESMSMAENADADASETDTSAASIAGDFCSLSYITESERPHETVRKARVSAQSRPCCTSWGPGRVDCFIRAPKSNVMHISVENGVYSEWEDLGGVIVDEIECVSRDVGIITVLVLDVAIGLNVNTFSDGKWSGWQSKSGRLMEVPSCVARMTSTINCMVRGTENQGYHIGAVDGKWTDYQDLGGILFSPFGCSSRKETDFNCFASGTDLNLYQRFWIEESGWGNYENLGGSVKGRPSVTTWDANRIDVFALGVYTKSVMQKTFAGEWLDWVDLGGVFETPPECVSTRPSVLHCFAVGEGSYLYRNSFNGTTWTGWIKKSYGYILETPACVVSNEDEVTCAVRRFNQKVVLITYNANE